MGAAVSSDNHLAGPRHRYVRSSRRSGRRYITRRAELLRQGERKRDVGLARCLVASPYRDHASDSHPGDIPAFAGLFLNGFLKGRDFSVLRGVGADGTVRRR